MAYLEGSVGCSKITPYCSNQQKFNIDIDEDCLISRKGCLTSRKCCGKCQTNVVRMALNMKGFRSVDWACRGRVLIIDEMMDAGLLISSLNKFRHAKLHSYRVVTSEESEEE